MKIEGKAYKTIWFENNLVKIIDPSDTMRDWSLMMSDENSFGNVGKTGVILSKYDHLTATCKRLRYTVLVDNSAYHFREDYLVEV